MQSSLDRARRLAEGRKKQKADKVKREEAAEAEAEQEEEEEKSLKFANQVKSWVKTEPKEEEMDVAEGENVEGITFTATTEFCRGLGANADDDERETKEKKAKVTSAKIQKEANEIDEEGVEGKGVTRPMEDDNEDRDSDEEDGKDEDDMEEDEYMHDEPLVSGGVAQALSLAKLRGLLKEEIQQAGRAKDEAYRYEDPAPGISIVHLDEFGRQMKPKEAFRKLSHVFHGRGPGPVKQEKKLRQFREEQKRGRIAFGTKKSTLDKLVKKQKKAGEAYVVLDNKARADKPKTGAVGFESAKTKEGAGPSGVKSEKPYVGGKVEMTMGKKRKAEQGAD